VRPSHPHPISVRCSIRAALLLVGVANAQDDACTTAATAVFEPCCPGGGGGYTACFYTSTSYTEMCHIAECTEALNAADRACAGAQESNPVAQAYQALRLAVSCAGLDDPCVASVEQTMDACQLSATLEGDPNAAAMAAQVVCTEPQCVSMLQQQVAQCSQAQDFSTILAVGMFSSILATCDTIDGAASAVTSATCDAQQMAMLMSTCYTDKAHTQTNCAACYPLLLQMAPECPGSFLAGPAAELNEMCAGQVVGQCPDIADSSMAVTTTCCDEPTEDCSSGMPASCNEGCAQVFIPFMSNCGAMLGPSAAAFEPLLAQCHAACPTCQVANGGRGAPGGRGGRGGGH
jgi:hypothetical protein